MSTLDAAKPRTRIAHSRRMNEDVCVDVGVGSMAPRGLKKILKENVPAKLTGKGSWRGFEDTQGRKLKGLTKALQERVWSDGSMPETATHGSVPRSGWRGRGGGQKRGKAVDAQLSRAVNSGKHKPSKSQYMLTRFALAALAEHRLEPVCAQRAVCDAKRRLGTAMDVLCYEQARNRLVVVELKCGYSGDKRASARKSSRACNMKSPVSKAPDNTINRHKTQLAVTRHMFSLESQTLLKLQNIGIDGDVGGALLYVNEEDTELHPLDEWWMRRAPRMMSAMNFS